MSWRRDTTTRGGRLASWRGGGAIVRRIFDERDLQLTESNFDAADHPVTTVHGVSSERDKYDRLRNRVEVAYFGPDGKPAMSDEGFAIERWTYDENDDLVVEANFDTTGAPIPFKSSYASRRLKSDERGLVVEESNFDVHGDPALVKGGHASVKRTRDRNGDVTEEAYLGKHGEAILREGGFARRKTSYDITRRPVEIVLFDLAGAPVRGTAGWAIERTTYDERGLVIRVDHLDVAKALLLRPQHTSRVLCGHVQLRERKVLPQPLAVVTPSPQGPVQSPIRCFEEERHPRVQRAHEGAEVLGELHAPRMCARHELRSRLEEELRSFGLLCLHARLVSDRDDHGGDFCRPRPRRPAAHVARGEAGRGGGEDAELVLTAGRCVRASPTVLCAVAGEDGQKVRPARRDVQGLGREHFLQRRLVRLGHAARASAPSHR
jgi:hypothetical protein